MKAFVVDTSAIVRLFVPDGPLPQGLESAVEQAWRSEAILLAPELALAEVAQVLRKKEQAGYLTAEEVDEILARVLELPVEYTGHRELLARALVISRALKLTVYDSLFDALGEQVGGSLITADERLARRGTQSPRKPSRR